MFGRARTWWRGKVMGLKSLARIAPHLRQPLRFCARQIGRRTGVACYRLRRGDAVICIRHSTPDVITMEEVLVERQYEPPPLLRDVFTRNGGPLRVADLGANIGLFSAWLLSRRSDVQVVAFEPDPANADVLAQTVLANRRDGDWRVVRACAATQDGELSFVPGEFAVSRIAAPGTPNATTLPAADVFPQISDADFLKLDIEGGEWQILADPRFRELAARALVLEYHPHLCPDADPRRHVDALLTAAGWSVIHTEFDRPDGHGVVWAWR